jgi:hypothetical protein
MTTETKMSAGSAMIEAQSAIAYAKLRSQFPVDFFDNPTPEMLMMVYQCGFGDGIENGIKRFAENTR